MITGVHHIALRALDFDASIKFYTEGLGMTVRTTWKSNGSDRRAALLAFGDSHIELFEGGIGEKTEPPMQAGEWFHLALRTDDPDGMYESALNAGAKSKMVPTSAQLGTPAIPIRIAFVYGPSGEVIEFFKEG